MVNKTLEEHYVEEAQEEILTNFPSDRSMDAVFMAGVQFGLDLREQELEE